MAAGMMLTIPINGDNADCSVPKLPRRLRRRLTESSTPAISADQIESKLCNARLRRQKLHDSASSKPKKHNNAAERKRLSILAHIQNRLARFDQLQGRSQLAESFGPADLRKKGSLHDLGQPASEMVKRELAEKLIRRWRMFVWLKGTTYSLAKAFEELQINQESVKSMSFEKLAVLLGSGDTIRIVESLLNRIESHVIIRHEPNGNNGVPQMENIDHLLNHVAITGKKFDVISHASEKSAKLCRYTADFVLGAYLVSSHPDVVSWGTGEYGIDLVKAAEVLSQEFETLINIMLQRPFHSSDSVESSIVPAASPSTFGSQLKKFDKAWCSYLYQFVMWKERDAKLLGNKLVRAASRVEVTRMHDYNLTREGDPAEVTQMETLLECSTPKLSRHLRRRLLEKSTPSISAEEIESKLHYAHLRRQKLNESVSRKSKHNAAEQKRLRILTQIQNRLAKLDQLRPKAVGRPQLVKSFGAEDLRKEGGLHNLDQPSSERVLQELVEKLIRRWRLFVWLKGTTYSLAKAFEELLINQKSAKSMPFEQLALLLGSGDTIYIVKSLLHRIESHIIIRHEANVNNGIPQMENIDHLLKHVAITGKKVDVIADASDKSAKLCRYPADFVLGAYLISSHPDVVSWGMEEYGIDLVKAAEVLSQEFETLIYVLLQSPIHSSKEPTASQLTFSSQLENFDKAWCSYLYQFVTWKEKDAMLLGSKLVRAASRLEVARMHDYKLTLEGDRAEVAHMVTLLDQALIKGPACFDYLKSSFASLDGSPSDATTLLALVRQWLSAVLIESEKTWNEYTESLSFTNSTDGDYSKQYYPTTLRTGSTVRSGSTMNETSSVAGVEQPECKGEKLDLLLRLGLLKLVTEVEGLTAEQLPETCQLNVLKLRTIQSQLQKIIVISTSILIMRQTLIGEHLVTSALVMEDVISDCIKQLSQLLDTVEDVGVSEIVEIIMNCYPNSEEDLEKGLARKDIMSNMLLKSLSAGDAVFSRVSFSVYLAARGVVLGGTGSQGKQLAETALKRIGAASLTQKLVDAVGELVIMANVSKSVHGAWYEQVLRKI